jgi:hypothetical protein
MTISQSPPGGAFKRGLAATLLADDFMLRVFDDGHGAGGFIGETGCDRRLSGRLDAPLSRRARGAAPRISTEQLVHRPLGDSNLS